MGWQRGDQYSRSRTRIVRVFLGSSRNYCRIGSVPAVRMAHPASTTWGSCGRIVGGIVLAIGVVGLVECFGRFALKGHGTPAPIAPPENLVVSGLYRHVRNPIYVALVCAIVGQALLFGSVMLLEYAGVVWLLFHVFVLGYEEPTLRQQFGSSYAAYQANVPRWWPRLTPWQDAGQE